MFSLCIHFFFFFNDTATTEIYTLSLHDALPISVMFLVLLRHGIAHPRGTKPEEERDLTDAGRSEEHTSELQSRLHLVCRLLLEKKKNTPPPPKHTTPHHPRTRPRPTASSPHTPT